MVDDSTLLDMIRLGSELAFTDLYHKYYPLLKKEAYYLLHSNLEAEDVVQDIFLSLWVRRQVIPATTAIKFYLFRAVHHKCIDCQRRQLYDHRHQQYHLAYVSTVDYNRRLDDKDLDVFIEATFRRLPTGREVVCRLKYKEAFSTKKIAKLLGTKVQTVKTQCWKGRITMRKNLLSAYLQ